MVGPAHDDRADHASTSQTGTSDQVIYRGFRGVVEIGADHGVNKMEEVLSPGRVGLDCSVAPLLAPDGNAHPIRVMPGHSLGRKAVGHKRRQR